VADDKVVSADAPIRGEQHETPEAGKMFPRAARLLKHSDFDRVYKQGRRHFFPHMTVFYLSRPEDATPQPLARVGFTVGRQLGGAVERNRIKRRLREVVRVGRAALPGASDVVINPKKTVLTMEFKVLFDEVDRAFATIGKATVAKAASKGIAKG
jgi:ribonuclease P protein component